MKFTPVLRLISNQAIDALRKQISLSISEAPQYLNSIKEEKKKIVYDRIKHLNKWYTKIIGLDELKVYQDRVSQLQDQLLNTQEKRRHIGRQLAEVRQKSIELQNEIHKVKRQEELDKFLELMKEETDVLKLEKSISTTFQEYDQMERELFTAFSNAIRDSHEKQRAQAEYTKYFGLILSIAGSFLAFVYTTVKKQDIKQFIEEKVSTLNTVDIKNDPTIISLIKSNETVIEEFRTHKKILHDFVDNNKSNRLSNNDFKVTTLEQVNDKSGEEINFMLKVVGGILLVFLLMGMRSS